MNTILRTPRLVLRRPRSDDVAAMHAILRDPLAMRYWSTLPHTTTAETEAWVAKTIDGINAGECDDFFVEHEGLLIGKAGLWRHNEIGFLFSPAVWGKGFAREALQAVVDRAFHERGLEEIRAEADPRNERCLMLLARLGFRETGRAQRTWHIGGEWSDSVYLSLKKQVG
ncbi:GNAT family N-acetyltransferase [Dongia deserti]|uniref:GNAT family N-acetyltransferase n=1 Tax=Dongia deserti TaxID=2268030 RepID=UPI000E65DDA3|nr:GNAT family N-acetyltransferase [Dongia deserti]